MNRLCVIGDSKKVVRYVAKSLFLAKSVQIEGKKCFFCCIFFGKPQFSFNKNTMNSGMLRHGRIFWKAVLRVIR